jgi:hypothetical protein
MSTEPFADMSRDEIAKLPEHERALMAGEWLMWAIMEGPLSKPREICGELQDGA